MGYRRAKTKVRPFVYRADDVVTLPRECGMHAFMYRGTAIEDLRAQVHRDNVAAKIHHTPLGAAEIEDYRWGHHYLPAGEQSLLSEAIAIQNLIAHHGLAPRVYGLALWRDQYGDERPMQITEDLGVCDWSQDRNRVYALHGTLVEMGKALGFKVPGRDNGVHNAVQYKWVDFNGFQYADDYHDRLMQRYWQGTQWGDRPYQQLLNGENDIDTCRNIDDRIHDLGLDALDFVPRHVCDIGCSGGQFLNFLTRCYGARGTGYDQKRAIEAAQEYSAFSGAWNIDYHSVNLNDPNAVAGEYDLVLFLSMSKHVGLPDYVKRCATKRLIVENHSEHDDQIEAWFGDEFNVIKRHQSVDYGRWVYHTERKI